MRRFFVFLGLWAALVPALAAPTILVMGDSLSAAYGIPLEQGWVRLLQARLKDEGYPHAVVNGSISGETTAGGLARLPAALARHTPAVVLIELGGNDGLRGLPLAELKGNLARLARLSREAGARPILFEMRIPPNYGPAYTAGFQKAFAEVGAAERAPVVPFFLDSLLEAPGMFQEDGIHPAPEAQPRMLEAVWPVLRKVIGPPQRAPASKPP